MSEQCQQLIETQSIVSSSIDDTIHSKQRCNELNEFEKERYKILSQCGKCANVLYADFRYDEICFALNKFKIKGLDLATLFEFQEKVRGVICFLIFQFIILNYSVSILDIEPMHEFLINYFKLNIT